MCQLLGMNCNVPTDICFSFTGFQARGGATDVHADGWGIAFFEGAGCACSSTRSPRSQSPIAELVRNYPIRSLNVIAHIRKATQGVVGLENTHPFHARAVGTLLDLRPQRQSAGASCRNWTAASCRSATPTASASSAGCCRACAQRFRRACRRATNCSPRCTELHWRVRRHGDFNFLLSNGDCLFAHCSDRADLHRAPGAVHRGAPEGPGRDGGLQRRHHSRTTASPSSPPCR